MRRKMTLFHNQKQPTQTLIRQSGQSCCRLPVTGFPASCAKAYSWSEGEDSNQLTEQLEGQIVAHLISKYILMYNPLLKNKKTQTLDDLQHRTSHYNRILCARSAYSFIPKKQNLFLNNLNSKANKKIIEERKNANLKLVKSLISIDQRKTLNAEDSPKLMKSLKSAFMEKEESNKIAEENLTLYQKIVKAEAEVGSRRSWRFREKKLSRYAKLLQNKRSVYLGLDQEFYSVYKKLRQSKSNRDGNAGIKLQPSFHGKRSERKRFFSEPSSN